MSLRELASELNEKTGLNIGALEPVSEGMDSSASCFSSGTFFIKMRLDVPAGVLLASSLTIPGVLSPLHIVKLSSGANAIIYPHIDAQNGFMKPLTLDHWEHVGRVLRQVHDFAGPTSYLTKESFQVDGVDTLSSSPLANLVELHWKKIAWIIEETERLGHQLSQQDWKLVPCHADLHVGNILTNEQSTWLVDWDTGRLAPRECDLVFFLGGGILGLHGLTEEAAFLTGYGQALVSSELIRYYRLARVLEDLVSFAQEDNESWFLRQFDSKLLRLAEQSS